MASAFETLSPVDRDIDQKDRVCHILNADQQISYCGLFSPFVHGVRDHKGLTGAARKRYCQENHDTCVVCIAEYERINGNPYDSV